MLALACIETIRCIDVINRVPELSIQLGEAATVVHVLLFTDMVSAIDWFVFVDRVLRTQAVLATADGQLVDRVPLSSCWAQELNGATMIA